MTPRQQWIAMLAKLVAPMEAPKAAAAFADMLPLLQDFPDAAFTLDSLEHVATQCAKFVPNYAELREHLGGWWRTHRPVGPSLPNPAPEPQPERTPEELEHAARLVAEVTATLRHHDGEKEAWYHRGPDNWRRPAAEMTRAQLNEAYRRESIKGPQLPEPVRAAAAVIPMPTKRGEPLDPE